MAGRAGRAGQGTVGESMIIAPVGPTKQQVMDALIETISYSLVFSLVPRAPNTF